MEKVPKKIALKKILVFVISFAFAYFAATYFLSDEKKIPNALLRDVSENLNKSMPKMVDSETRLDSTSVDNLTLNYHYTLIHQSKNSSSMDFAAVKSTMARRAQENLDNNPVMKDYRENNISLHYIFNDKNQNMVFDYTVKYHNQ